MSILKLLLVFLLIFPIVAFSESDLEQYYQFKKKESIYRFELKKLEALIIKTDDFWNKIWTKESTQKILDRMIDKKKKLLEKINNINKEINALALEYHLKTLETVSDILDGEVRYNCQIKGENDYLLVPYDEVFEAWYRANGDINKKIAYYASKNEYIRNCLRSTLEGQKRNVSYDWKMLCKKGTKANGFDSKYSGIHAEYDLARKNGQIVLSINFSFSYKGEDNNKKEAFKRLLKAKPCMVDFFARHGIKLDLSLIDKSKLSKDDSSYYHPTFLLDSGKPDGENWTTHVSNNVKITAPERCSEYIHELSHRLGLFDTYPDSRCPDRKIIMPEEDIMNDACENPDERKFFPSAIKKMLGPLCGGTI